MEDAGELIWEGRYWCNYGVATIMAALLNSAQPDLVFNRRAVWRVITFLIDISHYRDFTRRSEMLRINCILGISQNALLRRRNDARCNKPRNNRLILNSFLGHWICGKLCKDNLSILEFKWNFHRAVSRAYGVNQRVIISKCHLVEIITINRKQCDGNASPDYWLPFSWNYREMTPRPARSHCCTASIRSRPSRCIPGTWKLRAVYYMCLRR